MYEINIEKETKIIDGFIQKYVYWEVIKAPKGYPENLFSVSNSEYSNTMMNIFYEDMSDEEIKRKIEEIKESIIKRVKTIIKSKKFNGVDIFHINPELLAETETENDEIKSNIEKPIKISEHLFENSCTIRIDPGVRYLEFSNASYPLDEHEAIEKIKKFFCEQIEKEIREALDDRVIINKEPT